MRRTGLHLASKRCIPVSTLFYYDECTLSKNTRYIGSRYIGILVYGLYPRPRVGLYTPPIHPWCAAPHRACRGGRFETYVYFPSTGL